MAVTVQQINDKARLILQDQGTEGVRWLNAEIIGWVNSGMNEVVMLKPNALVNNESFQLTASSSKQVLPDTAGKQTIMLLDVPRNLGADGLTAGPAIVPIQRRVLDLTIRNWHTVDAAQTEVRYFIYDPRDPKHFYVYPPLAAAKYIEIVYTREPTELTAIGNSIDLPDIYEGCLIDYVLYRAFSKDSDFAGNMNRGLTHYKAFLGALGGKERAESASASAAMFQFQQPSDPSKAPPPQSQE